MAIIRTEVVNYTKVELDVGPEANRKIIATSAAEGQIRLSIPQTVTVSIKELQNFVDECSEYLTSDE